MNIKEKILSALKSVYDPELNINVVDLGLIYNIEITESNDVTITMTLTTPGCPLHDSITSGVRYSVEGIEETKKVDVNLVWEPAWSPDKMTSEGLKLLGR
ncbi:metal-sulfur cluster assembly factor [Neobacillus sp. MER 74]|uniref:metal-sulfur cluster assembly factor n=1 Tax=Bacillaceae TaxID=186817 RepID=UPI000BF8988E|nr:MULTISPECIES: metal-sulfur cluster assembly factor [Bacillaceae]MCM3114576.1 metal-sulfur cluster assembly factor [Neobacillus sp. MER 74]PFP31290.1 FeS assembly SUF system protein [Bacillus sp. AFS073361]